MSSRETERDEVLDPDAFWSAHDGLDEHIVMGRYDADEAQQLLDVLGEQYAAALRRLRGEGDWGRAARRSALLTEAAETVAWATDLIEMYDEHLIETHGDPKEKVRSEEHLNALRKAKRVRDLCYEAGRATPPSTDRSGAGDVQDFHDHSPEMKADHEHPATPDPDDGQEGEGRRRVESLTVEKVRGRYRLWECPCPDCENLYLRVPSGPCPECGQNLGSWDGVFVDRHPQDEGVREARSPFTKRGEDPADQGQIVDAFKECHRYHIDQHGEDYPPKATLGYFLDWIREVCQPALRALDADRSEEDSDG